MYDIYSNSRAEVWLLFSLVAVSGLVSDHDELIFIFV